MKAPLIRSNWTPGSFLVIFFFLLTGKSVLAQNLNCQVNVNVPQVMPSELFQFETNPFIFVDFNSDGQQPVELLFEIVVENDNDGEIFRIFSQPFFIEAGNFNTQFDNTSFMSQQGQNPFSPSFQAPEVNPAMEAQLIQTGLLPDGLYTICVYTSDAQSGQMFCQNCNNSTVFSPEPAIPINPSACDEIPEGSLFFTWTPIQFNNPVHYRVTVIRVLEGQTPEEALGNPPHAIDEVFNQTTMQYPAAAPSLEPGQYIWLVEAVNPEGQALTDPPFGEFECFTIPSNEVLDPEDPAPEDPPVVTTDITDVIPSLRDSSITPTNPTLPDTILPGVTDLPDKPNQPDQPTNPTATPGISDAPDKPGTNTPESTTNNPKPGINNPELETISPEQPNPSIPGYINLINPKDCADSPEVFVADDNDQFTVAWEFMGDFDNFIIYIDDSEAMTPGLPGKDVTIGDFENFPFSRKIIRPNEHKGKQGKQVQELLVDVASEWWNKVVRIFVAGTSQNTVGSSSGTGCTKFEYKIKPDTIPVTSEEGPPLKPPGPGDKLPQHCTYETTKVLKGAIPQVSAVIAEEGNYPPFPTDATTTAFTSRYLYPRAVPLLGLSVDEDEIQFICKGCPDEIGIKGMMVRDLMKPIKWEIIDGPGTLNTPPKLIEDIRAQIKAKEDSIQSGQKQIINLQNTITLHLDRSLEGYAKEIARLDAEIDGLNTTKSGLTTEKDNKTKEIKTLEDKISDLEKQRSEVEKEIKNIRKEQQERMEDLDWRPSDEELDALSKIDLYRDEMQKAADELEDLRVSAAKQVDNGNKDTQKSKDELDKAQKEYDDNLDGEAYAANELAGLKNNLWKKKSQVIILFNDMLLLEQAVEENFTPADDVPGYKKIKDQVSLMLITASSVTRATQMTTLNGLITAFKTESFGQYDQYLDNVSVSATNVSELEDFDVGLIALIKELFDKLKELEALSKKRQEAFQKLEQKAQEYNESLDKFRSDMNQLETDLLGKTQKLHTKSQTLGKGENKARQLREFNRSDIESGVIDVWSQIEDMDEKLIGLNEAILDSINIAIDHLTQLKTAAQGELDQLTELIAAVVLKIDSKNAAKEKLNGLINDANTEKEKHTKEIAALESKIETWREEIDALLKKVQGLEENSTALGNAVYYVPPPLEYIFKENGTLETFNELKVNSSKAKEAWHKAWNKKAGLQKELTADIEKIAALSVELETASNIKKEKSDELSDLQKEEKDLIRKKTDQFEAQWKELDNSWEQLDMRIKLAEKKIDSLQIVQDTLTKPDGKIYTTVKALQAMRTSLDQQKTEVETRKKTFETSEAASKKVQQEFLDLQRKLKGQTAEMNQLINRLSDVETELGIEMAKLGGEAIEDCPAGFEGFNFEESPKIRKLWNKQIDLQNDTTSLGEDMREVEAQIAEKTVKFQEIQDQLKTERESFTTAETKLKDDTKKFKKLYQDLDEYNAPFEAVLSEKLDWQTYRKRKKKEQKLVVKSMDGQRDSNQKYVNNLSENDPEIKDKKARIEELGAEIEKQTLIIRSITSEINELIGRRPGLEKARNDSLDLAKQNYNATEKALEDFLSESFKKTTYSVKIKQTVSDVGVDKWRTYDGPVGDTITLEYKDRKPTLKAKKLQKGSASNVGSPCYPMITLKKNGEPAYKFASNLVQEPITYALLYEKGEKLWNEWPILESEEVLTDQVNLIEGAMGIDADVIVYEVCTGGDNCPFLGQPTETDIADLSSHKAMPIKGSVVGQFSYHPDIFWEAGKVKGKEEAQRITFEQAYSSIAGPEAAGNKTDVEVIPGELVGLLDTIKSTPKEKVKLTARVVTGNYKGLKGETVIFEILENKAKKEVTTDGNGTVEWEYTIPDKGISSIVEVTWLRSGIEISKDTVYLITPLYLQNVRFEKGAVPYAWNAALDMYEKGGSGLTAEGILGYISKYNSGGKENTPVVRAVAGLTDEKADFVNKKELQFKVLESDPSASISPQKSTTKAIGISATNATFSGQKEEMTLSIEAAGSGDHAKMILPEKIRMEYESSQVEYVRIGNKKSGFVFKLNAKQSRSGPLSGTAKFWFNPEGAVQEALLKGIQKLPLELMGIEGRQLQEGPEGKKNLLVVEKGSIAWIPTDDNRPEITLKGGFKLTLTGFSVNVEGGASLKGLLNIKNEAGNYAEDPIAFNAVMDVKGNFYGSAASLPGYAFKGYKLRKGSAVVVDMHEKQSISDRAAPNAIRKPGFIGVVVRVAELEFPEEFSAGKDDETEAMALNVRDFYIGSSGVGGDLKLKNATLQMKFADYLLTGKSAHVVFENTAITKFEIGGEFRLPSPTRGTLDGTIGFDSTLGIYKATVKTKAGEAIDIRKLDARLDLNEGTIVWKSGTDTKTGYGELKIDAKFISRYNSELDIKLTANSDGVVEGQLKGEKEISFYKTFAYKAKQLDFYIDKKEASVALTGELLLTRMDFKGDLGATITLSTGPKVDFKFTDANIEINKGPFEGTGKLSYRANEFAAAIDLKLAKANKGFGGTLVMGTHEGKKKKDNYSYWYAELAVSGDVPLGQSGLSVKEIRGGLGYNYVPPLNPGELGSHKKVGMAFKASSTIGVVGLDFFKMTAGLHWLQSGIIKINGDIRLELNKALINGSGLLAFNYKQNKVNGNLKMSGNFPDEKGKLFRFDSKFNFKFDENIKTNKNYEFLKSERINGTLLNFIHAKGALVATPSKVEFEGSLSGKVKQNFKAKDAVNSSWVSCMGDPSINARAEFSLDGKMTLNLAQMKWDATMKLSTLKADANIVVGNRYWNLPRFDATGNLNLGIQSNYAEIKGNVKGTVNFAGISPSASLKFGYKRYF